MGWDEDSDLRFDEKNMKMKIKDGVLDRGRRKLGAIIGDDVKTGINISIHPGVRMGHGACIEVETLVRRDVGRW